MNKIYHIAPKRSGHTFVGNMIKSWCPYDEYVELENFDLKRKQPPTDGLVVVQTRELMNWLASYTKGNYHHVRNKPVKIWYTTTEYLLDKHKMRDKIGVVFDYFFESEEYRRCICAKLVGNYNEDWLNSVTDNQDGSTFDKQKYDGRAQEMNVLERYKQIPAKFYDQFFSDYPQYIDLNAKLKML